MTTTQPDMSAPTAIEELRREATLSVRRAAEILGCSKSYAYLLIQRGELPVIRLGAKRVRVPTSALRSMLGIEE